MWDSPVTQLLWILISIVVIIGLAYWFTRYVAGHGLPGVFQPGKGMTVLAQLSLGRDQKLVLAQVGERYFLFGVTAAQITSLAEFTEEEAAAWQTAPGDPEGPVPPSFREALQTLLRQKGRR